MMSLRETLINLQKEITLKELLKYRFEETTEEEKEHYLSFVIEKIEDDVDKMLNEYVDRHLRNQPITKSHKRLMWINIAFNIILSGTSSYAISKEQWVFFSVSSVLLIINQILPHIYTRQE